MVMPATHWTIEMVHALPDDGKRYEVIDGELFVTPAMSDLKSSPTSSSGCPTPRTRHSSSIYPRTSARLPETSRAAASTLNGFRGG